MKLHSISDNYPLCNQPITDKLMVTEDKPTCKKCKKILKKKKLPKIIYYMYGNKK